jgi:glycosyltransferase domain-containing protein
MTGTLSASGSLGERLTIVVPTRNRPHFFPRLLSYYRGQRFSPKIIFADSSDAEFLEKTKQVICEYTDLNLVHRLYDPEVSYVSKISDTLEFIETPYTALGADDDFFVPSGMSRALEYLEANADYTLAHGDAVAFEVEGGGVFGQIERVNRYDQRTIDQSTAVERLRDHFSNYSTTYYSVHRSDQLRGNFLKRVASKTDLAFGELLPSGLSLIQGKAKKLDGLFMARQNFAAKEYEFTDTFDWIVTRGWGEQYESFRDCLARELVELAGLEMKEARRVIKEVFVQYLTPVLAPPTVNKVAPPSGLRSALSAIPGARPAVQAFRSLDQSRRTEVNLTAMLNSSSAYHSDFMPIYKAITEPLAAY